MLGKMRGVKIAGTGSYAPAKILGNSELAGMLETTEEWILSRTGISERHVCAPGEASSDLGIQAARRAMEQASIDASEVDCVVACTVTPDTFFPPTAAYIQKSLGCRNAAGFDLSAACSGFVYGLCISAHAIASGLFDTVLLVGTEVMTSITDYTDRSTCILFGDGAGACVLKAADEGETSELIHSHLRVDCNPECLVVPAGGSRAPATRETVDARLHYLKMQGRQTFRFAVTKFKELYELTLRETGVDRDEIRWIVPHQVNRRILEAAARRCGFPLHRIAINLQHYGNTSAAGVPICLDDLVRRGELERGDLVLFIAFGAGFTWASALMRW